LTDVCSITIYDLLPTFVEVLRFMIQESVDLGLDIGLVVAIVDSKDRQ